VRGNKERREKERRERCKKMEGERIKN